MTTDNLLTLFCGIAWFVGLALSIANIINDNQWVLYFSGISYGMSLGFAISRLFI